MNREEARLKLEALDLIKAKGIAHHGYEWCDTEFYEELVEQMQGCRDVLMAPEPSNDAEWITKW